MVKKLRLDNKLDINVFYFNPDECKCVYFIRHDYIYILYSLNDRSRRYIG